LRTGGAAGGGRGNGEELAGREVNKGAAKKQRDDRFYPVAAGR